MAALSRVMVLGAVVAMLALATTAHAQTSIFSANQSGPKGDGTTLDTAAIQKAIDSAAKTQGVVTFPQSKHLTGFIVVDDAANKSFAEQDKK